MLSSHDRPPAHTKMADTSIMADEDNLEQHHVNDFSSDTYPPEHLQLPPDDDEEDEGQFSENLSVSGLEEERAEDGVGMQFAHHLAHHGEDVGLRAGRWWNLART